MKAAARYLPGVLVLGLLVWLGAYLYWHVTILGMIRSLETFAPATSTSFVHPEYHKTVNELTDSGCRALPYLVSSLGSSKAPWETSRYFFRILAASPGSAKLQSECQIEPGDPAPIRQYKIDRIRTWWAEAGPDHHQWWRVWSSDCRAAR
jgi:hypothetical protein